MFEMFKKELKEIWDKLLIQLNDVNDLKYKDILTFKDKTVLWANDMGFFGLVYGLLALYFWLARLFGGNESSFFGITNWTYVCVFTTLFAVKSWLGLEKIYKKQWNKLFPKGIVIPYINKTIK